MRPFIHVEGVGGEQYVINTFNVLSVRMHYGGSVDIITTERTISVSQSQCEEVWDFFTSHCDDHFTPQTEEP